MSAFDTFREKLKAAVSTFEEKKGFGVELRKAIEASGDWGSLEQRLAEMRTISRKREQEVVERLESMAERAAALVNKAKSAKVKVVKQSLLRQAQGCMGELEAEDEAAKIASMNGQMLTKIIKQVKKGREMASAAVDAGAIDLIAAHVEESVAKYEESLEATRDLEESGEVDFGETASAEGLEARLSNLCAPEVRSREDDIASGTVSEEDRALGELERQLFEQ
jgi:DNA-binding ferritin-like protein